MRVLALSVLTALSAAPLQPAVGQRCLSMTGAWGTLRDWATDRCPDIDW